MHSENDEVDCSLEVMKTVHNPVVDNLFGSVLFILGGRGRREGEQQGYFPQPKFSKIML